MNGLMELMKKERTTDYFRDFAIAQVKLAYRIKEYLDPDPMFPSKNLSEKTSNMFSHGELQDAVEACIKEMDIDIPCSGGYDSLKKEAIQFSSDLFKTYLSTFRQQQLKEKETLLARLSQIEKELLDTNSEEKEL